MVASTASVWGATESTAKRSEGHMMVRNAVGAISAAAMIAALSACGSSSDDTSTARSSASSGAATTTPAANGNCGTVPFAAPKDPQGAFAALPKESQQGYNGYSEAVLKSSWSDWKPKKAKA